MHPQRLVLALAVGIGVALNSRVRVHGTGSGELDSATKETSLHQRQGDVTATNVLSRPVRQENPDLVFLLNRVIQLQKILKSGKRSYATFRYQYMELIFKVGT